MDMTAVGWRSVVRFALVAVGALVVGDPAPRARDAFADPARPGMWAHVDPATGRLVAAPVVQPPRVVEPTFPAPLEEPAPGGGMMSVLHGRFLNTVVATIAPDGRLTIDCHTTDGPGESARP